jgi:MFS family permease
VPSLSSRSSAGSQLAALSAVPSSVHAGLRANFAQFSLLVIATAFVGGMVGSERTILPLIAQSSFGIASQAAALAFIATFGITKAATNLFAGEISDRLGRRYCLILGWLIGIPVPVIIMLAPNWSWVIIANVLLGINQALTWSMTINMKLDMARQQERGLAMGLNEFAGYSGVALLAFLTGLLAQEYGLRPVPFYLWFALALAGLGLSFLMRDTRAIRDAQEAPPSPRLLPSQPIRFAQDGIAQDRLLAPSGLQHLRFAEVFRLGTWKSAQLSVASLAGLATNLNDGMLWGLLPLLLTSHGLSIAQSGLVVAIYPAVWGVLQIVAGPLSDRIGRHALIILGLVLQGLGIWAFILASSYAGYLFAAVVVGLGTALAYPTLLAFVSDQALPHWRAAALGVYRFWRDLGYVLGALIAGGLADAFGIQYAFVAVAILVVFAALTFAIRVGGTGKSWHTSVGF